MLIRLIALGNKMPAWVNQGVQDYSKRLLTSCPIEIIEIPLEKRSKNQSITRLVEKESEKILSHLKPGNLVIALDIKGQTWSTLQLAEQLKKWQTNGRNIDMLIGGPEGLSPACLQKADIKWSLSPLTFPHPLVRVIMTEQLYRAWSILQNHPYHRE